MLLALLISQPKTTHGAHSRVGVSVCDGCTIPVHMMFVMRVLPTTQCVLTYAPANEISDGVKDFSVGRGQARPVYFTMVVRTLANGFGFVRCCFRHALMRQKSISARTVTNKPCLCRFEFPGRCCLKELRDASSVELLGPRVIFCLNE